MTTRDHSDDNWLQDDTGKTAGVTENPQFSRPWKILIVDDDADVHSMTRLALRDVHYRNRPLELLSAYSAAEGYEQLRRHPDTAIVLLDVVMETDDAGLVLANRIRNELKNRLVRIVLRTGQPGQAPEEKVIIDYDINDYKAKTDLTSRKLFVLIVATLRTYESLLVIDLSRQGLQQILHSAENLYRYTSLQEFASGVLSQVSAILGFGMDGVLCAQMSNRKHAAGELPFELIAATGLYADLPGHGGLPISHPLTPIVRKGFELGISFHEEPFDVLNFSAQNGYQFVIAFSPPWPLEDYQKDLLGVFCDRMASATDNLYLYQQLSAANEATVIALADLAEFRDESTGDHIVRVKRLTNLLVNQLYKEGKFANELTETFRAMIGAGAVLHDVGKVATPDHILLKPGILSPEERQVMQEHAEKGKAILENAANMIDGESYLSFGAQIAGGHHECYDGSGYPHGLKGNDIPLASRIVAVVDVFDALIHRRLYKEPWPIEQAIAYMRKAAGRQFDPAVIETFLSIIEAYPDAWRDNS